MAPEVETTKVLVITDLNGEVLGTLKAEPVDLGGGVTIQAVPMARPDQRHHYIEVPSHLVSQPSRVEELHREVRRRLPAA